MLRAIRSRWALLIVSGRPSATVSRNAATMRTFDVDQAELSETLPSMVMSVGSSRGAKANALPRFPRKDSSRGAVRWPVADVGQPPLDSGTAAVVLGGRGVEGLLDDAVDVEID